MSQKEKVSNKIEKLKLATDWFYSEEFNLDEASDKYEAALALAREVERDLDTLKNKIEVIKVDFAK